MDLDTWVSLGALLSVGAALIGYIRAAMRDLKSELTGHIAKLDTKVDAARKEAKENNDSLRTSMEAALGRIETRLTSLEQRTYDIKPGTSSHTG